MGLYDKVSPHFVTGENISQTAQFVESGNAQLGLISLTTGNRAIEQRLKGIAQPAQAGFGVDLAKQAFPEIEAELQKSYVQRWAADPYVRGAFLDDVLVPAARAFAKLAESSAWPWGGSGGHLSTTCAGASPYRWRRHGTGPGPTHSSAHAATAVDWARSWLRRINSNGA